MNLLPLTENYIFRVVFGSDPVILEDLLNSFPQFQGDKKIKEIKILNPEILGSKKSNKDTILDLHAEDVSGNIFLIEMQTGSHDGFSQRILYNWSKLYSNSLKKGKKFNELPKVYSINFLNFPLIKNYKDYIYNFNILAKDYPEICLTEDLEIIIVELPKLEKKFTELQNLLEYWIYLIRDMHKLKEIEMKTISKKSTGLNRAIKEVKFISLDVESRKLHEARLRAERNYQKKSYEKGLLEGIEKGKQEGLSEGIMKGKLEGLSQGIEKGREEALVESLYLGIELTLESHFNSKGLALLTSVKKIKDIEKLKKILETSIKSSSLDEVKQLLSK